MRMQIRNLCLRSEELTNSEIKHWFDHDLFEIENKKQKKETIVTHK